MTIPIGHTEFVTARAALLLQAQKSADPRWQFAIDRLDAARRHQILRETGSLPLLRADAALIHK